MANETVTPLTVDDVLATAAQPQSVAVDGLSVTRASTRDALDALDVARGNANATKRRRGLAMARIVPGSAVGGDPRRD